MIYKIVETWFRRFKVYEIGHTLGDQTWVATFRIKGDAERFVRNQMGRYPAPESEETKRSGIKWLK